MAKGKNNILVYRDWIDIFDELTDEEAGRLIKHFFRYVNDKNPECPDRLTDLLFKQIKLTLKRDLKKWEEKSEKNKENALLRWQKNDANACERIKSDAKNADKDKDKDKDNDSDSDKDIKFDFKKSLLKIGVENKVASDWLKVRKTKKASNTETAFEAIKNQIEICNVPANDCIKLAVEKSWSGFKAEWYMNEIKSNGANKQNNPEVPKRQFKTIELK